MNDRTSDPLSQLLFRIGSMLLSRERVDRVVAPAIADLQFEHARATSRFEAIRVRCIGSFAVLAAIALAWGELRARRAREAHVLLPALCVVASGLALRAVGASSFATRQLGFGIVGLAVYVFIVTSTRTRLARPLPVLVAITMVAWTTALWGESFDGAHRWLHVGALHLQPLDLVKPLFVAALGSVSAPRRRPWILPAAIAFAAAAAVAGDPVNVAVIGVVGVTALLSTQRPRRTTITLAIAACCLAVVGCAMRRGFVGTDAHTDAIVSSLAAKGGIALAAGTIGLIIASSVGAMWFASKATRAERIVARGAAAALATQLIAQPVFGEGVPWLSYGASSLVASLALFALAAKGPPSDVVVAS